MKKKFLCGLLTTAMLLGTFPVVVFASAPIKLNESLDFRNKTEDDAGNGWKWDASELTLTLENFRYSVPADKLHESSAIYLPDEAYVEIEGEDNILDLKSYHCSAFHCEGEVIFYGDGKLEISLENYGSDAIYVERGPIEITDEAEITIESRGYLIYLNNARGNKPLISIQDEGKLIFKKEDHESRNILLVKKSGVETSSNWLDYAEEEYEWDEDYIQLVAADNVTAPEKNEPVQKPENPAPVPNEYQIVIGSTDIMKNGEISYTADVVPYLKNGYTMLPLRALLEVSNPEQKVTWNNGTKSAHTFVNNKLVSIKPGETTYTKETETIDLRTPAETVNGRLFISLRDWMNIMEIDVSQMNWNPETKTITMKY